MIKRRNQVNIPLTGQRPLSDLSGNIKLVGDGMVGSLTNVSPSSDPTSVVVTSTFNATVADLESQIEAGGSSFAIAAGTNTYAATIVGITYPLTIGQSFRVKFINANTGAATLNINGLGAIAITMTNGDPLIADDIDAGGLYILDFDGTNFQIIGAAPSGGGGLSYGETTGIDGFSVTVPSFTLVAGAAASIKFKDTNTSTGPTLNINGTGGVGLKLIGGAAPKVGEIIDEGVYIVLYDGSQYQMISSGNRPIMSIRQCVYLTNDAAEATRMGGAGYQVYSTMQAAYDGAVAIQSGSNFVTIVVGTTDATSTGNLTLSANYNSFVIWFGCGKSSSVLGNITGAGFTLTLTAYGVTMGSLSTSNTGGNGGAISLTGDFITGSLTASSTNPTSSGGAITVDGNQGRISVSSATTTGNTSGSGGAVSLSNGARCGAITTSGGTSGNAGNITLATFSQAAALTSAHNGTGTVSYSMTGGVIFNGVALTATSTGTVAGLTITDSISTGNVTFTTSGTQAGATTAFSIKNSTFANALTWTFQSTYSGAYTLTTENLQLTNAHTVTNNSTAGGTFVQVYRGSRATRFISNGNASGITVSTITCFDCVTTSTTVNQGFEFSAGLTPGISNANFFEGSSITVGIFQCRTNAIVVRNRKGDTTLNSSDNSIVAGNYIINTGDVNSISGYTFLYSLRDELVDTISFSPVGNATETHDVTLYGCSGSYIEYDSVNNAETTNFALYDTALAVEAFNKVSGGTIIWKGAQSVVGDFSAVSENDWLFVDATTNATITLPSALTNPLTEIGVFRTDATVDTLTVDTGGENINGAATTTITGQYSKKRFKSDGVQWWIIGT